MRPKLNSTYIIVTVAAFILLIFLHSLEMLNPIEKIIFNTFGPVQKYFYDSGIKNNYFVENIKTKLSKSEVDLLKAQIRSLLVQNAKLKILGKENELLKKELRFKQKHSYQLVGARIIGLSSSQSSILRILQIDDTKYSAKDLSVGMPIIVEDGILIGKIISIKQNQIFMMPITASRSAVAATVLNKSNTIGVAEGELNSGIKIRLIPQTEKLKQGDLVITSGLEAEMPKGLLLGTLSKISRDAQSPFNIAHVSPLADLKRLSKILIIKGY